MKSTTDDYPGGRTAMLAGAQRAVQFVLFCFVLLSVIAMSVTMWRIKDRAAESNCPAANPEVAQCLGGIEPSSMTLELAGDGKRVAYQLHLTGSHREQSVLSIRERICVEVRVQQRWDELTRLDARMFIPSYTIFALLLAAWVALQARTDAPERRGTGSKRIVLTILVTTSLLVGFDHNENNHSMAMLISAERVPLIASLYEDLDAGAAAVRAASLFKWFISVFWVMSLAWGVWSIRRSQCRVQHWARLLSVGALLTAAAAIAIGVGYGATTDEVAGPVRAIDTGLGLVFLGMFAAVATVLTTRIEKVSDS